MTLPVNDLLARSVVAALRSAGVGTALVAPGSRSTPVVAALQAAGFPMQLVLDERALAYAAVGQARAGQIAAVVTTSGTAVANLLPGLAEAERDELPVVAVTADRPVREVAVRANQTLEQLGLLAGAVRGQLDLSAEDLSADWRQRLCDVLAALRGGQPGPVHLNLRFDKPLEPSDAYPDVGAFEIPAHATRPVPAAPWFATAGGEEPARGLVVVGTLPAHARAAASKLLDDLPWPALVDVTSGLDRRESRRFRPALMRAPEARARVAPDRVLWIGGRLVEPAVGAWLASADVVQWRTGDAVRASDGIQPQAVTVDFAASLPAASAAPPSTLDLDALEALFPVPPTDLSEPSIARTVAESVPADELLFVGSSMPIRDVDRFAARLAAPVLANRGASGIDGNLATAFGAQLASGRPVTALLGDLAFLHDAGSLGLLASSGAKVRVVCVNNSGGGIFHFLPIAAHDSVFEPWFTAPHDFDPVAIARGFGLTARRVESFDELVATLKESPSGPEVLEIRTERAANHDLHQALDARYREALR